MRVTLIASTTMTSNDEHVGSPFVADEWLTRSSSESLNHYYLGDDADWLAEFAGRACYESWNRPNPKTAHNHDYLRNIIDRDHFSVLEHASATFYVQEVSRTLTHELVRHRHLSFSQRSQRYVDESSSVAMIPEALRTISEMRLGDGETVQRAVDELNDRATELYVNIVEILRSRGLSNKEARGAARFILPASTETSIVVTGNHRAWREFISKRWHVAAEREIRTLAGLILRELLLIAPATYQDLDPLRPVGMPATDA